VGLITFRVCPGYFKFVLDVPQVFVSNTSWFAGEAVSLSTSQGVLTEACPVVDVPALRCKVIFNMRCASPYSRSPYHRIVDCLVQEFATVHDLYNLFQPVELCFVGFENRACFYEALGMSLDPFNAFHAGSNLLAPTTCIAKNFTDKIVLGVNQSSQVRGIQALLMWLEKKFPVESLLGPIVLVHRLKSRSWSVETYTILLQRLESLAEKFETNVIVYTGKETTESTMQAFYTASAVIMYHGAAAANLMFARSGQLAIEVTTYMDEQSSRRWRANFVTLKKMRKDVRFMIHHVGQTYAVLNATSLADERNKSIDSILKEAVNVSMSNHDVDNIVGIVADHITRLIRTRQQGNMYTWEP